jgi:uncharacterized membrane protein YccF (DUF307 family)
MKKDKLSSKIYADFTTMPSRTHGPSLLSRYGLEIAVGVVAFILTLVVIILTQPSVNAAGMAVDPYGSVIVGSDGLPTKPMSKAAMVGIAAVVGLLAAGLLAVARLVMA